VDFENAVAGDPLADLAKFRCWVVLGDADKDRALLGGYGVAPGAERERLALWGLYYALDSWCWYAAHVREGFLPPLRAEARAAAELG